MTGHSRRRFQRRVVALVAALALVAGACGGDDDADDGATPETTDAAETSGTGETDETAETDDTAATDDASETDGSGETEDAAPAGSPILIVATIDQSGPSATSPAAQSVLEAWATFHNANGGLGGHPIELEIRDTAGDAAKAQTATEELLALDPVLFVLNSPSTEAAQSSTLAAAEVPVMGVGYNPAVWGGFIGALGLQCSLEADAQFTCGIPNAFAVNTTFGAVIDQMVLGAQAAGATRMAAAACAEVDSCASGDPVMLATAAAVGIEASPSIRVSSTATDYSAECIQWIQSDVDFIQINGAFGVNLVASCRDQGYDGFFGASAGAVRGELIQIDGISLAGGIQGFPWWVDDPAVQEYRDAMEAGGLGEEDWGDPTSTAMWGALQLFVKAQEAGLGEAPTGAETLANMFTIENETLDGLIAPITITEDLTTRARNCFWPYILQDGEFTNPLGGLTYQCSPAES